MNNFISRIHDLECATNDLVALSELWREVGPPDEADNYQVYLWGLFVKHVRELDAGLKQAYAARSETLQQTAVEAN